MTTNGAWESGETEVVLGVDTHLDFHVAVTLDHLGRRLGEAKAPTTARGYGELVRWAKGFGPVRRAGVEGTGSYGAGLARHLKAAGIAVVEVERPKRRHTSGAVARAIPSTRSGRPGPCWRARRQACPRVATAEWR